MEKSQFCRCSINGFGRVLSNNSKGSKFKIIDLWANGARIYSLNEFEEFTQVKMEIILPAFLFQIKITTDSIITEKINQDKGLEYEIEFVGLSEKDKLGIDEIVRSTCK